MKWLKNIGLVIAMIAIVILIVVLSPIILIAFAMKWETEAINNGAAPH